MSKQNKKLVRITTIPESLKTLLTGQCQFMNQYFHVVGISSDGIELDRVSKNEGIRVIPLNMTRKITPAKDLVALLQLYRILKKEKPYIVHTHTPKAGVLGMIAAKMAGVPHRLHTIAGLPLLETKGLKRLLLNQVEKLTYASATKVYPNSKGLMDIVLKNKYTSASKLKVLANGSSNGIDTGYFNPELFTAKERLILKQKLDISSQDVVFTFIGRIVKDKGINELISAFKQLLESQPNVKLLFVGDYEREQDPIFPENEVFMRQSDKIILVGWQNDVRPFLSISDCLVFPSYREGFPNVVMQAGAMGLYTIASDINGCNEIIQDQINGSLIPVKDSQALYNAMKNWIVNSQKIKEQGAMYRKLIRESFEREYVWEALLKEYKELDNQV
ncbi:glycosyltransferase family 1 protein [Muriicola soli]|uniref:Glycosyltransferase family 1 protein n=2 Tax=Muriicola soli TaxID=2507538 RepID=A0A411ED49_9FLAO|nr:glycosyltransferase family 4 protein [Muriicola soli]QBA65584.1 glycosyltransferase family 1 protein [Muriicola soli]